MSGFEYLKKFLKDEGFIINQDDGFFSFKFESQTYFAFENETRYLQIIMACNTEKYSRSDVLDVCNKLNNDWYVLKFVARDKSVWCSYEFVPGAESTSDEFLTIFRLLDKASDELFENLK